MVSEWALMSHVACRNAYGGISPSSNPPLTKTSPADVRLGLGLRSGLEASASRPLFRTRRIAQASRLVAVVADFLKRGAVVEDFGRGRRIPTSTRVL